MLLWLRVIEMKMIGEVVGLKEDSTRLSKMRVDDCDKYDDDCDDCGDNTYCNVSIIDFEIFIFPF